MKMFALPCLLMLMLLINFNTAIADTISFPLSYTSGSALPQPQASYTYQGNGHTFDNLLVLKNANNNWYSVYYFNLSSWWPKATCANSGCSGNQVNTHIDKWLYAYDFGSSPVVFDYPAMLFDTYRSFGLNEVVYATFPIYDSNGTDILRESDTRQLTVVLNPQAGGTVTSDPNYLTCSNGICIASFTPGNVILTPSASNNWSFGFWDDGTIKSADNPLQINLTGDKTINAVFYPEMKMPLPGGKHWVLSVEAGGLRQCGLGTDSYHTGSGYYALDFVDYTDEDNSLSGTDVHILAAADGTVTESSCTSSSWGCMVVIDHGNNYRTRYAHMKTTPLVSQNDSVTRGQRIGIMGSTGNSIGTHLHFQAYYNGDSSSTNTAVKAIYLDGRKFDDYKINSMNCVGATYLSTNQ